MAGKQQPLFLHKLKPPDIGQDGTTVSEVSTTKKHLVQYRARSVINIGVAFSRWKQLREAKGLKNDVMVAVFLLDRYLV